MIVARITGGLGNQFFQYAAARALSLHLQVPLYLDVSFYSSAANAALKREFQLPFYNISSSVLSTEEIQNLQQGGKNVFTRVWSKINGSRMQYYYEKKGIDVSEFQQLASPVYLDGIFQSELFFREFSNEIRNELQLKTPLQHANNVEFLSSKTNAAIAVHVRRGDYVTHAATNQLHGVCSPAYYRKAMDRMRNEITNAEFILFTDDEAWAGKEFTGATLVTTAAEKQVPADIVSFEFMRSCKHFIIANSSYSWWAAWLSQHPGKLVIGPQNWFADPVMNRAYQNLIPSHWIKL